MLQPIVNPAESVRLDGYAVVPGVVDLATVDGLTRSIESARSADSALKHDGDLYGMRDILRAIPEVRRLAGSPELLALVEPVLGPGSFAVRGLLFDKTPAANWSVPWHQDLTIAVRERVDAPGFGPWTRKAGIPHVRPPVEVLEGMITLRVHLDDCGPDQGPLRVLPGSHRDGRLSAEATRDHLETVKAVDCLVDRGGVVMMRPLLLHASSSAVSPRRRRVVHLEYASAPLPGGVDWFEVVGRHVA